MRIRARLEFKLADMWIGVYWRRREDRWVPEDDKREWPRVRQCDRLDVWVCILPCMPLHVLVTWGERELSEHEEIAGYCALD